MHLLNNGKEKTFKTGVYLFLECFFISGVKNTTINNLDIRTFVVINREKRYFLVINRETRQLRLLIVNFTVNNRTIHDY